MLINNSKRQFENFQQSIPANLVQGFILSKVFFLSNSGLVKDCIGAHSCHGWPVTQVKLIETQLSLIIWRMPDHMLTKSMSDSMQ